MQPKTRFGRSPGHANAAEDLREKPFFTRGVNEAAVSERRGIEGTKAACTDDESEDEGAHGTKDDGAKLYRYGGGGGDRGRGKDENIRNVRKEIGKNDERHGGVDDTRKIAGGREKFADNVTSLWGVSGEVKDR